MKSLMALGSESPFHESYFAHPCKVLVERDVLAADIPGEHCWAKLRRWWGDLFLLSYSNKQCRVFFVSSQALRIERVKNYRNYRGRIHPLSKFSEIWSYIALVNIIVNRFAMHQNSALFFGRQSSLNHILGIVTEVINFIDLYINLKTGYTDYNTRRVVLDYWEGLMHYSSRKLFLHVIAAIPFHVIMLLRYGLSICAICRANTFICSLKLLSLLGYYRLYDASAILSREGSSKFKPMQVCKFLRIFVLAMICMLHFLNLFDTLNILIMIYTNHLPEDSYFRTVIQVRTLLKDMPDFFLPIVEISILIKCILLSNFGIFRHEFYLDKLFGLLSTAYGLLFLCWTAIEFHAVLSKQQMSNEELAKHKKRTFHWMRCEQVSEKIRDKVDRYFEFYPTRYLVLENDNQYYCSLPTVILRELKNASYYRLLRRIPYFSDWPVEIVEDIVMLLKEEVFLENDVVVHAFSQTDGLLIVEAGVLAVYNTRRSETGHLIDGDYFGELSLITDNEVHTSSVVAVTICKMQILCKSKFRKYMKKYPELFFDFRKVLKNKYRVSDDADFAK